MLRVALLFLALTLSGVAAEAPLDTRLTSIKFTGHATLHDFSGEAQDVRGSAQVDPADRNLVTGAVVDIGVDRMTTFSTGRDRNMRAWLDAAARPTAEFRLEKLACTSGDPRHATEKHPALFTVTGAFMLNGETKPLTATVTGWRSGAFLYVEGITKIDTSDYGLPVIHQFFMTVRKNVDVSFRLVFHLPAGV